MPTTSTIRETHTESQRSSSLVAERLWPFLLFAITLGAIIPMLIRGANEFVSYDGFWHLFIATQNRWKLFLFEYKTNAHPPIFFLFLRIAALFGHSRLVIRSVSISAGAGSIVMVGLIARKLCSNSFFALLAAAAYGFSITMLLLEIDVRSYSLCLFFVLVAFYFFVDFLQQRFRLPAGHSLLLCGIFLSIAIATEYYAIFFLFACLGAVLCVLVVQSELRQQATAWFSNNWRGTVFAFLLPFITIGYLYRAHLRHLPPTFAHVSEFYWVHGSSVPDFVLRNLRADLNFVLPLEITSNLALLLILGIAAAFIIFFSVSNRRTRDFIKALPALIALVLLIELIAASLLGRYPFGGFDRQQSILFPFFFLTAFVLLDQAATSWLRPNFRIAVAGLLAILIGTQFTYGWRKLPRDPQELFTDEYRTFQSKVAPAQAIYLDQFTLIGYYIQTNQWRWKFHRHLLELHRIDQYELTPSPGQRLTLFRDLDAWNFDLHNPAVYEALARSLRTAGLTDANLFLAKQSKGHADAAGIAAEESEVKQLAAHAGLQVTAVYDDNGQADIAFAVVHDSRP